jgi:hypothetical protein
MSDRVQDLSQTADLRNHRRTFHSFGRLVLFAILHVALTLGGLALAFLGHIPLIALVLWLGGTLGLISLLTIAATYD